MAPTAMKTVPSGRVERFMKGASWTGGGDGGGYVGTVLSTVFESVGSPVGLVPGPRVVVVDFSPGRSVGLVELDSDLSDPIFGSSLDFVSGFSVVRVEAAFALVFVLAAVVGFAFPVVTWVVGRLLSPCASPTAENVERVMTVVRRSDRFKDMCDGAMTGKVYNV